MFRATTRSLVAVGPLGALSATAALLAPSQRATLIKAAAPSARRSRPGAAATAPPSSTTSTLPPPRVISEVPQVLSGGNSGSSALRKSSRALITPPRAPLRAADPTDEDVDAGLYMNDAQVVDADAGHEETGGAPSGVGGLHSVIDDPELVALVVAHKAKYGSVKASEETAPSAAKSREKRRGAEQRTSAFTTSSVAAMEGDVDGGSDDAFVDAFRATSDAKTRSVFDEADDTAEAEEVARTTPPRKLQSRLTSVSDDWDDEGHVPAAPPSGKRKSRVVAAAVAKAKTGKVSPQHPFGDADADDEAAVEVPRGGRRRTKSISAESPLMTAPPGLHRAVSLPQGLTDAYDSSNGNAEEAAVSVLTNPFRGIHGCLARSYRLDQLVETSTAADAIFARQERKSGAFSFLQFKGGKALYEGHWASLADLQSMHQRQLFPGGFKDGGVADMFERLRKGGIAVPGFSLFNNNLGLYNPRVTNSFPLLLAQRLLLFPDGMRHFHTLCGRENVPCDFFADIDLPDVTPEEGEKTLLEVINYLEVRLPGIGFTDPFFLVLTNAEPSKDKVSYHLHVRSMTFQQEEAEMAPSKSSSTSSSSRRRQSSSAATKAAGRDGNKKAKAATAAAEDDELVFNDDDEEEDDDLTDLVNVVDSNSGGAKLKKAVTTPKVVAFQDYRTVKLLADEVNQTIGKPVIDDNCYRVHGMLRCAFSSKLPSSQDHDARLATSAASAASSTKKRLVPLITASDSALRQKLKRTEEVLRTMTDPEILELSFCSRYLDDADTCKFVQHHLTQSLPARPRSQEEKQWKAQCIRAAHRHKFKLLRPRHVLGPQSAQAQEYDAYGNIVSPFLTEAAKWKRYNHVVQKLRSLPPRAAEGYDVWVRVGLALHNFSNEDHVFEEWVRFSLKSPQKYSREVCRKKWTQFERNPDALNWRRGFNYLNSTVWRQV